MLGAHARCNTFVVISVIVAQVTSTLLRLAHAVLMTTVFSG